MKRLVRLYPRAWRDRYLAELEDLLADRPPTIRDQVDLARGALDAWVHPQLVTRPSGQESLGRIRPRAVGAAVLGGGLWIAGALATNATQVSATSGYKDSVAGWMIMIAAAVLTAAASIELARSTSTRSSAASATAATMLVGALLIATPWPILAVGFYGYAFAAAGFGFVVGDAMPLRWLLSVTALVLTSFNTQDERALLAIPFGLAWIAIGSLAAVRVPAAKTA
ncbi:MAG TPA: hypothetical protein VNM34_06170 [Verrucomicrobiae bacterium]|nr:hypothetical protein [Verrucomicrobiae bacterium]